MGASSEGPGPVTYDIRLTPSAVKMLKDIKDQRIRGQIVEAINGLAQNPETQGKPLIAALLGYRSLRVVGQRYRVIYTVEQHNVTVVVIAVGIRKEGDKKDIYALANRLVRYALRQHQESESDTNTNLDL